MPDLSTLNFGFQGIEPWCQSRNFTVGKARIKMVSNIRIQHMSRFEIFYHMYLMNYINYVLIPDTSKHLNYPVVLGD